MKCKFFVFAPIVFVLNMIRAFKLTELYQPAYNPAGYWLICENKSVRSSEDRFKAIRDSIDTRLVKSYLDIGSQLGYFVFKMQEYKPGIFSTGIEMNKISFLYSQLSSFLSGLENVSFMNTKFSSSVCEVIPRYDVISFLSVFHHVVHFDGFDEADRIMKGLFEKVDKYFLFETGQYDEKGYYWSECLEFMGDDSEPWLLDYLKGLGFSDVKVVGRFGTHLSDNKRSMFLCVK